MGWRAACLPASCSSCSVILGLCSRGKASGAAVEHQLQLRAKQRALLLKVQLSRGPSIRTVLGNGIFCCKTAQPGATASPCTSAGAAWGKDSAFAPWFCSAMHWEGILCLGRQTALHTCTVTSRQLSDTHCCCCPDSDVPIRAGPCPHAAHPSQSQPIFWLPTSPLKPQRNVMLRLKLLAFKGLV